MSDLAYSLTGEAFEVPPAATGWRVRRMKGKGKGAPEVVYDNDGKPLTLEIDADIDDLKREVDSVGKYRLDLIDENDKPIANVPAAYVFVKSVPANDNARNAAPPVAVAQPVDSVARAMELNTSLARAVIEPFAQISLAHAELLRAAAGVPVRPVCAAHPLSEPTAGDSGAKGEDDDDDDQDDDEDDEAPTPTGLSQVIAQIAQIAPALAQLGPALAALGLTPRKTREARPAPAAPPVAPSPPANTNAPIASSPPLAPPPVAPSPATNTTAPQSPADTSATATPDAAPAAAIGSVFPPALVAHMLAVQAALSDEDAALARAIAQELTPDERGAWLAELSQLSVADAAAQIRAMIHADATASGAPTTTPSEAA